MNDTLLKQLEQYENQWVALLEETNAVVGNGKDASEAKRSAEQKGFPDVVLFRVLPFRGGYVAFA